MSKERPFAIVGAGFSGAVLANRLAAHGHRVDVFESRGHVGGNCHTELDAATGILVHRYGPHIFHTDRDEVWHFIQRYGAFRPYLHRVRTQHRDTFYSLPINLHTLSQFFGRALSPEQARKLVGEQRQQCRVAPRNFEEQALQLVGAQLYEAFFKHYTEKQWGRPAREIPASVFNRLPIRFDFDDRYFSHPVQAIPEQGYTALVQALLDEHPVTVHLNTAFTPGEARRYRHVVWTGPLDAWFGYDAGRLPYRTLDFEEIRQEQGDIVGCSVLNYADADTPFTRIAEHKYFAPWAPSTGSVAYRERSRACTSADIPFYPVRLADDRALLTTYQQRARLEQGVSFLGRLGTFRYLDMDQSIAESLQAADVLLRWAAGTVDGPPVFFDTGG